MHTKRIIPCLDVKEGRVVKGVNFVGLKDVGNPVDLAEYYYKAGADELVFLDITATHEGRGIMRRVVEKVAEKIFIPFTVGGGLKNLEDIKEILRAGADITNVPVIASGGCGELEHFYEVFKDEVADAALAASLFHYGELSVEEVKKYLKDRNISVRY